MVEAFAVRVGPLDPAAGSWTGPSRCATCRWSRRWWLRSKWTPPSSAGGRRHRVWFLRPRLDLSVHDVPLLLGEDADPPWDAAAGA
ncbi:hypothetical protein [Micromonospora sp. ATA51]|uniref:hypothetical protein n=1 Tax=Micromonospora sp. ATA51 TaxID=2806098 RepID=UPI001A5A72AC|nr:hypothetical protein [Micromonospora sp. ATA51]MBM0224693.1 hypothetical protein [Micromonospora sp. ATA51]